MSTIKYVAAGFLKDSENLLKEFIQENSTSFTVFTAKWKEHNFGLIYSGRDEEELQQFTNEIFQLTLGYLESGPLILHIGAIYLLYALYRNQRLKINVQIRITLPQKQIVTKLLDLSRIKKYMHLHYIINFLLKNAFDHVANSIMLGPCCSKSKIEVERAPTFPIFTENDCKTEMQSFKCSNLLEELNSLNKEYATLCKKLLPNKSFDDAEIGYHIDALDSLLNDAPCRQELTKEDVVDLELGNRRAKIKADQFSKKASFRQLNPSDSDKECEPEEDKEKADKLLLKKRAKRAKKKRIAKEKRKLGRPKNSDVKEILETDESDHDSNATAVRKRGPVHRLSYTAKYELKIPDYNKTIFKDFIQNVSSSEEESSAIKKENEDTQDKTPDKEEAEIAEYCNEYPEKESSEEESEACDKYDVPDYTVYRTEEECIDDPDDPDSNKRKDIYTLL